jgi:hypothetical protein
MATTPNGVTPLSAKAISPTTGGELGKIRSFLLDHEKLLIVIIVAITLWWGYGKYAQIRLDHDNAALQQQKLVVAAQVQQNAAIAAQAQKDAAQAAQDKLALQALTDKVTAQNQQLVAANTALATALTKQQHTDATLPVPALVDRWAQLAPGTNFTGAIGSGNNVEVTPSNALATVQQLEKVPVLTTELANETTLKTNDDLLIGQQNKNIFDLGTQVATLNTAVTGATKLDTDHEAQCVEEKKVMTDKFNKSKRHWFVAGYIAGFVSHVLLASKGL